MVIIVVMLVLIILFALWLLYAFHFLVVIGLVNGTLGAIIFLRGIHDLDRSAKKKRNMVYYTLAILLSLAIYLLSGNIFRRFLVFDILGILLIAFVIAQAFIWMQVKREKHNPVYKKQ